MTFITHDEQRITGIYSGNPDGLATSDNIQRVPDSFEGSTGMALSAFDQDWSIKPKEQLIEDGLITRPEGMVFDETRGDWRTATEAELVADGRRVLGEREKLEGDLIVQKSLEELDAKGLLTGQEKADWERSKALTRLREIDTETVRPLRAILAGEDTKAERDRLTALENEAKVLRQKVRK